MPMWNSVANLKESLSKIALDVHDDDDDDLSIYTSPSRDRFENGNSFSDPRISSNFNHSYSPSHSPLINGFSSPSNNEIEQYKKEIKRLQESEAEIKALSVNYAALLKEKEDQVSRLSEENGTLKQNLITTNASLSASKTAIKGSGDLSPIRQNRGAVKFRTAGNSPTNGIVAKTDGLSNGTISPNVKELSDMMEEKNRSLALMQETHEAQIKQMVMELDREREKLVNMQIKLKEEQNLNASFQQELSSIKVDKEKMLIEMQKIQDELNQKMSEIGRLQLGLQRRNVEESDDTVDNLKKVIASLEYEKNNIKKEKDELESAFRARSSPIHHDKVGELDPTNKHSNRISEAFPGKEEMQQSLQKLEKDLEKSLRERDKALQGLNRLKQHLLEKESEESEKMDEDSKIIEDLRENNEHQRRQISRLEKSLKQAIEKQDEIRMSNNNELRKTKETIDELHRKLICYERAIDANNMEVLNLQTALGQYYAEIEAKERLGEELSVAKEELARLAGLLKEAHQHADTSKREKEEILGKLSHTERMLADVKNRVKKLEEDNEKLRRALEQNMTRLNRMSLDSDFLVDRRIVIKLLVTYFQRNHSKEVLDLMVRMLGFSEEDKQRIGIAQKGAAKGVVRGVFGFPGRLVGGIMGSGSSEAATTMSSDDQSFADLWVDFLLKETEREKRESMDAANGSTQDQYKDSPIAASSISSPSYTGSPATINVSLPSPYHNQNQTPFPSRGNLFKHENSESEFSTVPLTSSDINPQNSRLLTRY